MRDLGRNGCYLVLRTLEQDVAGFWRFAQEVAGANAEGFAASMVGRTRDGAPLAPLSGEAIPGVEAKDAAVNQFTFDGDAKGSHCPFGAHIRRANPRNADLPTPAVHGVEKALRVLGLGTKDLHSDAKASTRFHRILRRGREFGPELPESEAVAVGNDDSSRGIHFICLTANIARQFEFLQSAWMMSSKFDALTDESDPLLGNREPVCGATTDAFTLPSENGIGERVTGLPQFVTVKGGAYVFLPSLAFLRYLSMRTTTASSEGERAVASV
jgi:deferrochelatase/peroxidase EfeB